MEKIRTLATHKNASTSHSSHQSANKMLIIINAQHMPFLLPSRTPIPTQPLNLNPFQNRPCLFALPPTPLFTWKTKFIHTIRLHLDRISRIHGSDIVPALNPTWVPKVLMQMVDILEYTLLAAHHHIIDSTEMLCVLWKADAAAVGDNGDVEFGGHEENGNDFVYATQAAGVDLANVDCARGEELLEHDAVLAHFTCCDADVVGLEGLADGFVSEHCVCCVSKILGLFDRVAGLKGGEGKEGIQLTIIRTRGLLDKPRFKLG